MHLPNNKFTFALKVQNIKSKSDKLLVLANSVGLINNDGFFSTQDINSLTLKLRIPSFGYSISTGLSYLKKNDLVVKNSKLNKWSLTPLGKIKAQQVIENISIDDIELTNDYQLGSFFGTGFHSTIPPEFAPVKWTNSISKFLEEFPFETNVFLMTRFPVDETDTQYLDPIEDIIEVVRSSLERKGLTLHLASDRLIEDDLLSNVAAHMWACNYGIGIFEDRLGRGLNYNVVTEIGAMLMTGRRCALIKDKTAPNLPTDIVGQVYKPADLDNLDLIEGIITKWVDDDLLIKN